MCYDVVETHDRGRCVIALTHIPNNSVVLKERPFLVAEDVYDALYSLYSDNDSENDKERQAFEGLSPMIIDQNVPAHSDLATDMMSLPAYMRDFFDTWKPQRLRLCVAKFQRNAFRYTSPPCALLAKGAMFNHSCCNNVDFAIDARGAFVFTTNRDVLPGEELCDKYIDTSMNTQKRQRALDLQYGFNCTCSKCLDNM